MTVDPFDCAFLYARGPADLEARGIPSPRNTSVVARLGAFCRRVVRRTVFTRTTLGPAQVLFYVESANQLNTLLPVARELGAAGYSTCLVGAAHRHADLGGCAEMVPLGPGPIDSLKGLLSGLMAAPAVLRRLKKIRNGPWVLDQILEPYRLAPMFRRVLLRTSPSLVIVANDHITSCRVLTQLARQRQIRTAYLQHAQVSLSFPPLAFDFALLDGMQALKIYSDIAQLSGTALPDIFLSGEKKTPRIRHESPVSACVGLGVNPLDDPDTVHGFVESLLSCGVAKIIVRLHPALRGEQEKAFRLRFSRLGNVDTHLATDIAITEFLGSISCLVAGESSVHIDALINRVPSFYANLAAPDRPAAFSDYYGFVAIGLTPGIPEDLSILASSDLKTLFPVHLEALKQISATVGTCWEGRESELAARTLAAAAAMDLSEISSLYPEQQANDAGGTCYCP